MELRHLEHFVVLAEELNFTRAAARLNLVQSALSVSIRNLEKDLGAVLFDRTNRAVRLTEAGKALLPGANQVLREVEAARDSVAAVRGTVRGTLRIGMMQSVALIDTADVFTSFHQVHPEVVIEPRPDPRGAIGLVEQVREGELDLAFAWYAADDPGIVAIELATEPLVLVAPEGHPLPEHELTVADLAGQAFIDFTEGWGVRTLTDLACGQAGVQRQTVVEVTDTMMCAELVRAGFGLAVLPSSQFSRTWGLTSRTVSGLPSWGVSLVASAARPRSAASAAFAALVGSVFDRALPPALAEGR